MADTNTKLPAAALILQRAHGWGERETAKFYMSLTEEERTAIAELDHETDFGPELRRILDAVANRKAAEEAQSRKEKNAPRKETKETKKKVES